VLVDSTKARGVPAGALGRPFLLSAGFRWFSGGTPHNAIADR
jgi:hypothetical protein